MRNAIRGLQTFGLYLLPTSLLALCGILAATLLHRPTPTIPPVQPTVMLRDDAHWEAHAEAMFLALLLDALRQSQEARETRARTLRYAEPLPAGQEPPALIRL